MNTFTEKHPRLDKGSHLLPRLTALVFSSSLDCLNKASANMGNDALTHAFPASLELMAIFVAATGLLVPEYRSVELSELKWAYWLLVWGTTVCGMAAALVAGISLLGLSGGPVYPRVALTILAGIVAAVIIGAPIFTFFAVAYVY